MLSSPAKHLCAAAPRTRDFVRVDRLHGVVHELYIHVDGLVLEGPELEDEARARARGVGAQVESMLKPMALKGMYLQGVENTSVLSTRGGSS